VRTLISALGVLVLALALSSAAGTATAPPGLVVSSNYRPLLYGDLFVVGAGGGARRKLTHSPYDDQLPSLDPTGRKIAFVSDRSGYRAVWVIGVDGKGLRRVTGRLPHNGFPNSQPLWDPTGRWLLFDGCSNAVPNTVWTVPAAGGTISRVGVGYTGVWSPTGLVTFTSSPPLGKTSTVRTVTRLGAPQWSAGGTRPLWSPGGLLAVNHDLGKPAEIFDRPGHILRTVPGEARSWSPRGELLASVKRDTLWITGSDGSRWRVASEKDGTGFQLWWTPDGTTLSYTGYTRGGHVFAAAYDTTTHRVRKLPGAGPWSPDGKRYVYGDQNDARIYVVGPGGAARVTQGSASQPVWVGDDRLLYAFSHGGEAPATLHLARATGGLARAIGKPGNLWEAMADWSPDGKTIAFSAGYPLCHASHCARYFDNDIWVRSASGSPSRKLTSTPSPGNAEQTDDANPAWSPDGDEIAFTRTPYGPNFEEQPSQVWIVPSSGGAAVQVAKRGGRPSWSPDGKSLSFNSDGVVAVAAADGSGLVKVTLAPVRTGSDVTWSPDGSKLAAIAPNGDVFTISPSGSGRTVVLRRPTTGGPAAVQWSPDGSRLAVADGGIYVIELTTGRGMTLDPRREATRPRWSPDGRQIAYSVNDPRTLTEEAYVVSATGGKPIDLVPGPSQESDPAWRPR
jgi:Tol biopolymer transport system component